MSKSGTCGDDRFRRFLVAAGRSGEGPFTTLRCRSSGEGEGRLRAI